MKKMYRQGDVLIQRIEPKDVSKLKKVPREAGRIVLAHGEATGHAHAIESTHATLYALAEDMADQALRLLEVKRTARLSHEEHSAIELPPGLYRVIRQREFSPEESRYVAD